MGLVSKASILQSSLDPLRIAVTFLGTFSPVRTSRFSPQEEQWADEPRKIDEVLLYSRGMTLFFRGIYIDESVHRSSILLANRNPGSDNLNISLSSNPLNLRRKP